MKELSLHILDIVQNSIRAEATYIKISVIEEPEKNIFSFSVEDNGKGMDGSFLRQVKNPFITSRTSRKIGLGIPLLEQACMQCGGALQIDSKLGCGTTVQATMEYDHIDRVPLGDMVSTLVTLLISNPNIEFLYTHGYKEKRFILNTEEIKQILNGVPIDDGAVMQWLKEYIEENLIQIKQTYS